MIYYDFLCYFTENNGYFVFMTYSAGSFDADSENDYPHIPEVV